MYTRSAAFDSAIRYGHKVVVRAEVLSGGVVVPSTGLRVIEGNVTVDGTAAVRRQGSLKVVDPTGALTPNDSSDTLSPYGRELRLYKGIALSSGDELLALATLRISSSSTNNQGQISLTGFDRARSVSRARFETPYVVASGVNYGTAIQDLLTSRLSGLTFNFVSVTATTPLLVFDQGADPWEKAQEMAKSVGCELFFDPLGIATMRYEVDPAGSSVAWDYGEGPTSMVLSVDNTLTDEPGYNGIVVDGEAPGVDPVHSVVYDTNPSSPTYSLGPYGKVPRFIRSQYITTQSQADAAAAAGLLRERGGTEQVKFSAILHPAHEAGDIVRVADSRVGIDDNYLIESFPISLGLEASTVTTRKRRTS